MFDPNNYNPPSGSGRPGPGRPEPGRWPMVTEDCEFRYSKSSSQPMLVATMRIFAGPSRGRRVWRNFMLTPSGYRWLKMFCDAINVKQPIDPDSTKSVDAFVKAILYKPFVGKVEVTDNPNRKSGYEVFCAFFDSLSTYSDAEKKVARDAYNEWKSKWHPDAQKERASKREVQDYASAWAAPPAISSPANSTDDDVEQGVGDFDPTTPADDDFDDDIPF